MNNFAAVFILATVIFWPIAAGYFTAKTERRFLLHLIVIISFIVRGAGSVLKILHWTGADELLMISQVGFGLGGLLLIWTGLRNPTGGLLVYQLICGGLIVLIVLTNFFPIYELDSAIRFAPYPLAALSATIIANKTYVHQGEKNMLIMYLIGAIEAVILDLVRLL
jgi:hypothetical protein